MRQKRWAAASGRAMTSRILIGDVFAVPLDENVVGFFQYIARDLHDEGSDQHGDDDDSI
jgi:hypothetical protein